jgi:hypothetical protein
MFWERIVKGSKTIGEIGAGLFRFDLVYVNRDFWVLDSE